MSRATRWTLAWLGLGFASLAAATWLLAHDERLGALGALLATGACALRIDYWEDQRRAERTRTAVLAARAAAPQSPADHAWEIARACHRARMGHLNRTLGLRPTEVRLHPQDWEDLMLDPYVHRYTPPGQLGVMRLWGLDIIEDRDVMLGAPVARCGHCPHEGPS